MMKNYDLAIIGSGPGGYVTALYAARHNLKVCVIEKGLLGGVCLNNGCIPTKSLLNSASIISSLKNAPNFGINIDGYSVDFGKMMARKGEVMNRLRTGIETLFRANKIDLIKGSAKITAPGQIVVDGGEGISAKNIIIASGSRAADISGIVIDNKDILSSDGILEIGKIPSSLVVIGGGVIGCEFASLFAKLGAKVTIIEMMDRLIASQSREVSKKLESLLTRSGVDVRTSASVEKISRDGALEVVLAGGARVKAEKVLVSVGRVANIDGLGLESVGVRTSGGKICVDELLRTSVPGVYAVGDCVAGPQLAHKASYDGLVACDNILGANRKVDYSNVPNCIWTDPEIASVGVSEDVAKERSADVKVAKFPYMASGKAYLEGSTEGFVKIVGTKSGEILGVEIFGKDACNLIGEAVVAKRSKITIEEWSRAVHGHPTLSEILQEACHVFCGTPIHSI